MIFIHLLFGLLFCYATHSMIVSGFTKLPTSEDVTYDELLSFQVSCPSDLDNCKQNRFFEDLTSYTCLCEESCVNLRTCCVDSPYRNTQPTVGMPSCRSVSETLTLFIVEECPRESPTDSAFKQECESYNTINEIDLLSITPVTSSSSGMTYKNYFCFRCHESHDDYVYWNLRVSADVKDHTEIQNEKILPVYDRHSKLWLAAIGQNGDYVNVTVNVNPPHGVFELTKTCIPDVISDCAADWEDSMIRRKCKAYAAYVTFKGRGDIKYRNPHCAMCNYEDLREMICYEQRVTIASFPGKKPFSFTHLLDINTSDGDKVGKVEKCSDDSTWDPFFKKCRTLKCALPGYVVKNGKCAKK